MKIITRLGFKMEEELGHPEITSDRIRIKIIRSTDLIIIIHHHHTSRNTIYFYEVSNFQNVMKHIEVSAAMKSDKRERVRCNESEC